MVLKLRHAIILYFVAALALGAPASAATIGNCQVTGPKGAYAITPAIPGQLTVEVNLPAPFWWNGDTIDSIMDGYEYCLAANIAYRLGLAKVQPVNVDWDAMVSGRTHNFDVAFSQISITPDRQKVVDFSQPYYRSNIGVLVRTGTKIDADSIKSLRIGVQQGSTGESFVTNVLKPAQPLRVYTGEAELYTAAASGEVDAVLTDVAESLGAAADSRGRLSVVAQYDTGEVYGGLFPKNSPNEATINKIIISLVADGTTAKLAAQYLGGQWGQAGTSIPYFKP